jgi:carbonic anhydrase
MTFSKTAKKPLRPSSLFTLAIPAIFLPLKAAFIALIAVCFCLGLFFAAPLFAEEAAGGHAGPSNPWNPETALQALKAGNDRFATGKLIYPNSDKQHIADLSAHGQFPMAAILSCSDSRVPVEEVFDLGFGDIFSIRVAGEVPGVDQVGSIEYAVAHLGTPLIVVLGHTKCGAVTAAVQGAEEPGSLGELLSKLSPIAREVSTLPEAQRISAAIDLAATRFKEDLPVLSPVISELVNSKKVGIVAAVYDIDTGVVTFKQ